MDVVFSENVHNKFLIYSGIEALSRDPQLAGRGNLQGQETNSFDEAFVEIPSRRGLGATTMERDTVIEIEYNCQTNAKYDVRQITNTINTKYFNVSNSK